MMRTYISVCAALLATSTALHAANTVDGSLIATTAESAVRAAAGPAATSLTVQTTPLDPRLRLAACDQPLQAFITGDGQLRHQNTVGVRCAGSVHWTVYASVAVDSEAPVLVARHPLTVGTEVSAKDFDLQTRHVPGLINAYVTDVTSINGQRLRRALLTGEVLPIESLSPALLVHRGQQVVLLAKADGFEVRMSGIALADGGASDRIKVENLSSEKVVEGIVRSDHEVETLL